MYESIHIGLINEANETSAFKPLLDDAIARLPMPVLPMAEEELAAHAALRSEKGYDALRRDNVLYLAASNSEMLYLALTAVLAGKEPDTSFRFPSREEYLRNIDCFTPVWTNVFTPPAWLLDYEEKKDSFAKANRPYCWAHRGGNEYYPDNSIEAIISSIKMGADVMELDFRYTKDKRIVLMHWETLHQSTDWEEKHGKNGLPESDLLADWTFDELRQLRLKAGAKCNPEAITEYVIATLEEVLTVCNKRVFFIMDKMDPYKEWNAVLDCIERTGCYEAFAFAYKYPEEEAKKAQAEMLARHGATGPWFYDRRHSGSLERECLSDADRLAVFEEFSAYPNAVIMTNYVGDLVRFIDERYHP